MKILGTFILLERFLFSTFVSIITALQLLLIELSKFFSTGTSLNPKKDFTSSRDLIKFLLEIHPTLTL